MESPAKDTSAQRKIPLDEQSRDDLLKNCKKQMVFLQKLKLKCDDLQRKLQTQANYAEIKESLTEAKQKIETSCEEIDSLKQNKTQLQKSNRALNEELECLKMKQETLLSSLQCLQEDFNKVSAQKQDFAQEKDASATEKKCLLDKLTKMENEQQDLCEQVDDKSQQLLALKGHIKKAAGEHQKLSEQNETLVKESKTMKAELAAMRITIDSFKTAAKSNDGKNKDELNKMNGMLQKAKLELEQLKQEKEDLINKIGNMQKSKDEELLKLKATLETLNDLPQKIDALRNEKAIIEKQLCLKEAEASKKDTDFRTELDVLKQNLVDLKDEKNRLNEKQKVCEEEIDCMRKENIQLSLQLEQDDATLKEIESLKCKKMEATDEFERLKEQLDGSEAKQQLLIDEITMLNKEKKSFLKEIDEKRSILDGKISDYENIVTKQNKEIETLTSQYEASKRELVNLQDTNISFLAELERLKEDKKVKEENLLKFDIVNQEHKALEKQFEESIKKCNDLAARCEEFEGNYLISKDTEKVLMEKLKQLEEICNLSNDEVLSHKSQIATLQSCLDEKTKAVSEYIDQLQLLETENTKLKADIAALEITSLDGETPAEEEPHLLDEREATAMKYQFDKSQAEYNELQKIYAEEKSCLQKELETLQDNKDEITCQLKTEIEKCKNLEEELEMIKSSSTASKAEVSNLLSQQEECKSLKDKVVEITESKHKLENLLKDQSKETALLEDKLRNLQEKVGNYQSRLDEQSSLICDLQEQLNISKQSIKCLKTSGGEKDIEVKKLQEDINLSRSQLIENENVYKLKIEETEAEKNALSQKLHNMSKLTEEKLETQGHAHSKAIQEYEKKLEASVIKETELIELLNELKQSCENKAKEIVELNSSLDKLNSEMESHEDSRFILKEMKQKAKDLQHCSKELDDQVKALTEENMILKQKCETLENATQVVETASDPKREIDTLQQSLKQKETYTGKLKAIAVKTKKELDAAKQQLAVTQDENTALQVKVNDMNAKLMESQAQVASSAQMLQVECDKLQDEIDLIKSEKLNLVKALEESQKQTSFVDAQKEDLQRKFSAAVADTDKVKKEKSETETLLSMTKSSISLLEKEKNGLMKEKLNVKQELEASKIQVTALTKKLDETQYQLKSTQCELTQANKTIKQNDVMTLEMAQYEATVCGLQTQVSDLEVMVRERDTTVQELEKKVIDLNEEQRSVEQLRVEAEERVTRTKELLDATRAQVAHLSEDEHELRGQLDTTFEQLESLQQQNEEQKVAISAKTSECRVLEEKIHTLQTSSQRSVELLERKLSNTQGELEIIKHEKESLSSDYENYKVRVHSVLKQQKNKASQPQQDREDEENQILALKEKVTHLQSKIAETQNILSSRDHELDLLQGDYDRLLRQQQQSSEGALERETRWKSRVKTLQQELQALRKQHADVTSKLSQQKELVASAVAKQLDEVQVRHDEELASLREELNRKDAEIEALRKEVRESKEDKKVTGTPKRSSATPALYHHHSFVEPHLDYRSVARESGEGEENHDDGSVVSFEQILQAPQIKPVTEMSESASLSSELQLKQLEAKFNAQTKQLQHTTEVARENESTALRLADQTKVLKEEIRRLEKNQERDKSVSSMEYLKNVLYKFVTLPPSDERFHLVPVMDTMLKFNVEERKAIETLARGEDTLEEHTSSGWGTYLQRWSGMQ